MKVGRPTRYRPEYSKLAFALCLVGYTDDMLSEVFRVAPSTIYMWKSRYEEFSEALRNGKAIADAEVANALYQRAIGYEHPEEWIGQYKGQPVIVKTIKRYPPDTAAASLWLRNRQPELWREKQEVEHSKGPVTIRVVSGIENSPGSLCRDGMDDENGSATAAPLLGRQGHI